MKGEHARENSKWLMILFSAPSLLILVSTVVADVKTYLFVKAHTVQVLG